MRLRLFVSLVPLALAVALWFAVFEPARRERDAARAEYGRVREQREALRTRAAELERAAGSRGRPEGPAAARALRASLLAASAGLPLRGVQLSASAGSGRLAGRGRLSAVGRMPAVVRLGERLAQPGSGLVLERLELAASADEAAGIRIDAEVHAERPAP